MEEQELPVVHEAAVSERRQRGQRGARVQEEQAGGRQEHHRRRFRQRPAAGVGKVGFVCTIVFVFSHYIFKLKTIFDNVYSLSILLMSSVCIDSFYASLTLYQKKIFLV